MSRPEKKTNVVPATTSFVGRESDLVALQSDFRRARLVSIVGPPGSGKTRLALEFALRFGGAFLGAAAGGAWFCDLSEAESLDDVFRSVAQVLDVSLTEEKTQSEASSRLAVVLAARGPTLLLLDNFEQLVQEAMPALELWLARCPELSLLVTSRVRLGAAGEILRELSGLAMAGQNDKPSESDAARLFLDRAQLARHDFSPSDEELAIIGDLVLRLDGLPLAIELAGARMGVLGPKQLLDRLGKSLDLLRGGKGRASTLRATLDWSWNLLEPAEQDALGQTAIFHGGFSLEAAEQVIDLSRHGAPDLLDVLESLRNNSLLRSYSVSELPGEVRFGLLDIVRAYAEERLISSGQMEATRARHARTLVAFGKAWDKEVERRRGPEFLSRLVIELPNLTAVHRHALTALSPSAAEIEDAISVTLALEHVFYMRGPTAPCLAMLDEIFEHDLQAVNRRQVALALKARGRVLRDLGRFDECVEELTRALEIARADGDRSTEGRVLGHFGFTEQQRGKPESALEHFRNGVEAARSAGDRRTEGMLLAFVASMLMSLGRFDEAMECYDQALIVDEEVGNRYAAAAALALRGELNRARGRPDAARLDLERALEGFQEFGERRHEGMALADLGMLHQEQGRFDDARRCLEQALQHHREFGSRHFQAYAHAALGDLHREQGRNAEARREYQLALSMARELSDKVLAARLLASLGAAHAALGRLEGAREALAEAETLLEGAPDPAVDLVLDLARGHHDIAVGNARWARERLERAPAELPLAARPAAVRVAYRILDRALDAGTPIPNRDLTPSNTNWPSQVGRYELLIEIASGGMATVYAGRQRGAGGFERVVAIKRMHPHLAKMPDLTSAFMDEARIASSIRHSNVVSVHDVDDSHGEPLLVMDYVDGTSLSRLMSAAVARERRIPRKTAAYVLAQTLRGLHAAHEQADLSGKPLGIVHRDASPHNILLGADGSVRITDFGIAKFHEGNSDSTKGVAKGKFRYMAPEQAASFEVDRRADVFALGVVAWELFTGRRLFSGESDLEVVVALAEGQFPEPSSVDSTIPDELTSIVSRAMAHDRDSRFWSALEFAEALESWAIRSGETAREPELAGLVEELCGDEVATRRRALSDALAQHRTLELRSVPAVRESSAAPFDPTIDDRLRKGRPTVSIAESGRWFVAPNGERVSLQRRRALRLILKALADRRTQTPGQALTQQDLLEAGWPGEKVRHEAGTLRVYNALSTLRKLGLREVLLSRDDGYLLDPGIEVERVDDAPVG